MPADRRLTVTETLAAGWEVEGASCRSAAHFRPASAAGSTLHAVQLWVGLPHGERGAGLLAPADDPELIVLTGEPVGG